MNYWTKISIEYANQKSYLDDLFEVYPTIQGNFREIDDKKWEIVERAFKEKDCASLLMELLKFNLFPIKDSYVAFLKRDKSSIERNPETVNRLCERLYKMGLEEIYERCSQPKETNRQIGPMFDNWVKSGALGLRPVLLEEFTATNENAILVGTDTAKQAFARKELNFYRNKGLDFLARFNGKYVIGEAKFLSDFGGSQNSDFEDAVATLDMKDTRAIRIAILDGVLYLKTKSKMHNFITDKYKDYRVMSALVLKDFLHQL